MATGVGLSTIGSNPYAGIPVAILGGLLARNVRRINVVCDNEYFEILVNKGTDNQPKLEPGSQNFFVGGRNRWKFSTFYKWGFWPSKECPVLFYFRENQTKPEGQFHLTPVLFVSI